MPNWQENVIRITGKNAKDFLAANTGPIPVYKEKGVEASVDGGPVSFTFHKLIPVPIEVLEAGYSEAGYAWQNDNWGTKWDCAIQEDELRVDIENEGEINESITIEFSTPWGPPVEWLEKVFETFPQWTIEVFGCEEQMLGVDYTKASGGKVLLEISYDDGEKEFYQIASDIFGYDREYFIEMRLDEIDEEEVERIYKIFDEIEGVESSEEDKEE